MKLSKLVCSCQSLDEIEQVRCFVRHYESFRARRGDPVSSQRLAQLRKLNRIQELDLEVINCPDTTDEIATSLILQTFIDQYCETHPTFARKVPPSNFAPKIDFFKTL